MDTNDEVIQQLKDSAFCYLNLGKRESEVFAYKATGIKLQDIAEKIGVREKNAANIASRMFKNLKIEHRLDREDIVQNLGIELLEHYDELVAPLVDRSAEEILTGFHKLDEQLGR